MKVTFQGRVSDKRHLMFPSGERKELESHWRLSEVESRCKKSAYAFYTG